MKKKLLTILLSMALVAVSFVNAIYADSKTIGNLLDSVEGGFPTSEQDGWICEYGSASYLNGDDLIIFDPVSAQNIVLPTSTVLTQDGNNYKYTDTSGAYEVLFEINNNKLIQFVLTSSTTIEMQTITVTLIYKPFGERITMPDLFTDYGEDFPAEEEYAWINSSRSTAKMFLYNDGDNDYLAIFDEDEGYDINIPFMFVLDVLEPNTKYSLNMSGISIDFIIDSEKLKSVVINAYPGLNLFEGTYMAPLTVADILDTVDGGYPASVDDETVPDGCWTTSDGYRLYYSSDRSELYISDTPFISISASQPLTLDADGNYTANIELEIFSFTVNISFKMVMSNNKLKKIEATRDEDYFVFEPLGNRKTFDMLFKTLGDKKPNSDDNAWINENGYRIYVDDNDELLTLHEANIGIYPLFSCLDPSGNNYSNTLSFAGMMSSVVTANMNGSVIKSLNINYSNENIEAIGGIGEPEKQMLKDIRGTYKPYEIVNEERNVTVGSTGDVEFKTYANYQNDPNKVTVKVQLEGEASSTTLAYNTDYTLQTGSTIVKLKGDYVKTLPLGTHTITIEVEGYSSVSQNFNITTVPSPKPKEYKVPNTGVR